ncbi:MAG: hypothetical protein E7211_00220 [Clostridium lundense]|nr:hypothetical protein [Clostridium lundense]
MKINWKRINTSATILTILFFRYLPSKLQVFIPLILGIVLLLSPVLLRNNNKENLFNISMYIVAGLGLAIVFVSSIFNKYQVDFIHSEKYTQITGSAVFLLIFIISIIACIRDYKMGDINKFKKTRASSVVIFIITIIFIYMLWGL